MPLHVCVSSVPEEGPAWQFVAQLFNFGAAAQPIRVGAEGGDGRTSSESSGTIYSRNAANSQSNSDRGGRDWAERGVSVAELLFGPDPANHKTISDHDLITWREMSDVEHNVVTAGSRVMF